MYRGCVNVLENIRKKTSKNYQNLFIKSLFMKKEEVLQDTLRSLFTINTQVNFTFSNQLNSAFYTQSTPTTITTNYINKDIRKSL